MKRLFLAGFIACARDALPAPPAPPPDRGPDTIELVESEPVQTPLDVATIPDAHVVWPEMIARATSSIDLEEFYASSDPAGKDRLEPTLVALERATARGVRVRLVVDETFYEKYPEVPARLAHAGVLVKRTSRFDKNGGVQHAKYFVVDREETYVGSQNLDYRSLEHIQEIGVRVRSPSVASAFEAIFEGDWSDRAISSPVTPALAVWGGEPVRITPVFSPRGALADEGSWDLPRITAAIDGASHDVRVQLLTYDTRSRDGSSFTTLDDALRRAAARGVRVRMIVSEWARRHGAALAVLAPAVDVRVLVVAPIAGRDIPFARVVHAKYMVADARIWIGSSNWEGDYFEKSRNAGLVIEGAKPAAELAAFFDRNFALAERY